MEFDVTKNGIKEMQAAIVYVNSPGRPGMPRPVVSRNFARTISENEDAIAPKIKSIQAEEDTETKFLEYKDKVSELSLSLADDVDGKRPRSGTKLTISKENQSVFDQGLSELGEKYKGAIEAHNEWMQEKVIVDLLTVHFNDVPQQIEPWVFKALKVFFVYDEPKMMKQRTRAKKKKRGK